VSGDPVNVEVDDDPARHRFEARVDGRLAAFASYERTDGGITFLHTETLPAFEGRGVGSRLAHAALDDARRRGLRVTPRCPFFAQYIEHHPDYADLVDRSG